MKYTAKQIEHAALICQIAASNLGVAEDPHIGASAIDAVASSVSDDETTIGLAYSAYHRIPLVHDADGGNWHPHRVEFECAEAETWIRSGWREPGDELEFAP